MQVSRVSTDNEIQKTKVLDVTKHLTHKSFDNLLEKLNIKDLAKDEKELFFSIMKDKTITKEEFSNLDYEQTKKLKEFISRSDLQGNALPETIFIFSSLQIAPLLATTDLSNDHEYNKAVFNSLKKLNYSDEFSIKILDELLEGFDRNEQRKFENNLSNKEYNLGIRYKKYMNKNMQEVIQEKLSYFTEELKNNIDETSQKENKFFLNMYKLINEEYKYIKEENNSNLAQFTRKTNRILL